MPQTSASFSVKWVWCTPPFPSGLRLGEQVCAGTWGRAGPWKVLGGVLVDLSHHLPLRKGPEGAPKGTGKVQGMESARQPSKSRGIGKDSTEICRKAVAAKHRGTGQGTRGSLQGQREHWVVSCCERPSGTKLFAGRLRNGARVGQRAEPPQQRPSPGPLGSRGSRKASPTGTGMAVPCP